MSVPCFLRRHQLRKGKARVIQWCCACTVFKAEQLSPTERSPSAYTHTFLGVCKWKPTKSWQNSSLTLMRCDPSIKMRKTGNFCTPVRVPIFWSRRPRHWESRNFSTQAAREKVFWVTWEKKRWCVSVPHSFTEPNRACLRACARARRVLLPKLVGSARSVSVFFLLFPVLFCRPEKKKLCQLGDPALDEKGEQKKLIIINHAPDLTTKKTPPTATEKGTGLPDMFDF